MVQFLALAVTFLSVLSVRAIDEAALLKEYPGLSQLADNGHYTIALRVGNEIVEAEFGAEQNQKRGYGYYNDDIPKLMRSRNAHGWCKNNYIIKPVTVTKTVWSTQKVCASTQRNRACITPVVTLAVTNTVSTTDTHTETATETSTYTSIEETSTKMETETTTETLIETTTLPATTVTVEMPSPVITITERNIPTPVYLRKYSPHQLASACAIVVPRPRTTQTVTRTTVLRTRPAATTSTTTHLTTVRAATTIATTTTITSTSTSTPITTATTTITATITTTTSTTPTKSVCPQTTQGIAAIGARTPNRLLDTRSKEPVDCCTWCFQLPGCSAWLYSFPGVCYAVITVPNEGDVVDNANICPHGRGDWLFLRGDPNDDSSVGGRGQCAGTEFTSL
ncbi:hypothetical protein EDC01DRAFT_674403 [Geopyxis carbonaria]|nr:hypothetical protein EDC01DRAFT_674403 [Geopyxis carbonaria]